MSKSNGEARELVLLSEARRAIAEAKSFDDIKEMINKAEAVRMYLKKADRSLEAMNEAAEVKILAERKAGDLLSKMEKSKGTAGQGRPKKGGNTVLPPNSVPTLKEIGVSKIQSQRYQLEASVPERALQKHISEVKEAGEEITSVGVRRLARQMQRSKDEPAPQDIDDVLSRIRSFVFRESSKIEPVLRGLIANRLRTIAKELEESK